MKHHYLLSAAVALFSLIPGASVAQTTVSSIISSDQTWDISGSPYLIQSNVLIEKGVKVTIKPGTVVKGSNNNRIIINGELVANGKKDTIITMDTVTFEFTSESTGYDFSAKTGSNFSYCLFRGTGMGGSKTIDLNQVSMLISNCKFLNTYYTIYGINANTDTAKVRVEKSVFDGGPGGYTYVIYPTGRYAFIEIDECSIKNTYGLYLSNYTKITRCSFYNWMSFSGLRINAGSSFYPMDIDISCNSFVKFQNSIIEMFGISTTQKVTITNNTFDSSNYFIDCYPNGSGANKTSKLLIAGNNFLRYYKKSILFHGNSTTGKADTLSFRGNYWNTSNTTTIAQGITDFNDDVTIPCVVDYGSLLGSSNTQCTTQNPGTINSIREAQVVNFSVAPNPVISELKINTAVNGEKTVKIYTLSGSLVLEASSDLNNWTVDCSKVETGLYVVELSAPGFKANHQKLLVTK